MTKQRAYRSARPDREIHLPPEPGEAPIDINADPGEVAAPRDHSHQGAKQAEARPKLSAEFVFNEPRVVFGCRLVHAYLSARVGPRFATGICFLVRAVVGYGIYQLFGNTSDPERG